MPDKITVRLFLLPALAALLGLVGVNARAQALAQPAIVDGDPAEWVGQPPDYADPTGDRPDPSYIDFGRLWMADTPDRFIVAFEAGLDLLIQDDSNIFLYVDADNTSSTGRVEGSIGAEFVWRFGTRSGTRYDAAGDFAASLDWRDLGVVSGPTVQADFFEVSLDRALAGLGGTIALVLVDTTAAPGSTDQLPDSGDTLTYTFGTRTAPPPEPIGLDRRHPLHVRAVSWNTLGGGLQDDARDGPFDRVLTALAPDIVCFQEESGNGPTTVTARMAGLVGGPWFGAERSDVITAGRWPITRTDFADGNLGVLFDLPDADYGHDLYVINAHLPCCSNDAGRQAEADNIAALMRELTAGAAPLPAGTPILVTGDMNFVGLPDQRATLLTGDIADNATYGPDAPPDWDGSPLVDLAPRQSAAADVNTWVSQTSSFGPGRLDYAFITDSAVASPRNFVLDTADLSSATLAARGLLAGDTAAAADHLPVVVDLQLPGIPVPVTLSGFEIE